MVRRFLLLLIVAMIGSLTVNPTQSCPPGSCSPLQYPICVWNPYVFIDCAEVVQTGTCECLFSIGGDPRECANVFRSIPVAGTEYYSHGGERPAGTCATIPCGICYNRVEQQCSSIYECRTQNGVICETNGPKCTFYFLADIYKTEYWKTQQTCCWDAG
jgi:hypothetical protein